MSLSEDETGVKLIIIIIIIIIRIMKIKWIWHVFTTKFSWKRRKQKFTAPNIFYE